MYKTRLYHIMYYTQQLPYASGLLGDVSGW